MRLYCLTRITLIPPLNTVSVVPYNENADEINLNEIVKYESEGNISKNEGIQKFYQLTEICIGWKKTPVENRSTFNKAYYIHFCREDIHLYKFPMIRGAVKYIPHNHHPYIFDLIVATSKLYPDKFSTDLSIKIRCTKNTPIKGISPAEKLEYKKYAKYISHHAGDNEEIHYCCRNHEILRGVIIMQRTLEACEEAIARKPLKLCDTKKAKLLDFTKLMELNIIGCDMQEFSDEIVLKLSSNLKILKLRANKITSISNKISNLINLQELDLNGNFDLDENGIPWNCIPSSVKILHITHTSITKVPEEIGLLVNLEDLTVGSEKLIYIAWKNISSTIENISIEGGDLEINEPKLRHKNSLKRLYIYNTGLTKIDCQNLPSTLINLLLPNNKVKEFLNIDQLQLTENISLYSNSLIEVSWENLPVNLSYLCLTDNEIREIGNLSHLQNLIEFEINQNLLQKIPESLCALRNLKIFDANANFISTLPFGFENLMSLKSVDFRANNFLYDNGNLSEKLWKRLPSSLNSLNLDENNTKEFPCHLHFPHLLHLNLNNCNLKYICPYFYTNVLKSGTKLDLNIILNPDLKYLPFIPSTIFPPPKAKQKKRKLRNASSAVTVKTDNKEFRNTSRFLTREKKHVYEFQVSEEQEDGHFCQCCAACGENTEDPIIEQMMVMDFSIVFVKVKSQEEGEDYYFDYMEVETLYAKSGEPLEPMCYLKGEWKTIVKTRFCTNCKEKFIEKVNNSCDKNLVPEEMEIDPSEDTEGEENSEEEESFDESASSENNEEVQLTEEEIIQQHQGRYFSIPVEMLPNNLVQSNSNVLPPINVFYGQDAMFNQDDAIQDTYNYEQEASIPEMSFPLQQNVVNDTVSMQTHSFQQPLFVVFENVQQPQNLQNSGNVSQSYYPQPDDTFHTEMHNHYNAMNNVDNRSFDFIEPMTYQTENISNSNQPDFNLDSIQQQQFETYATEMQMLNSIPVNSSSVNHQHMFQQTTQQSNHENQQSTQNINNGTQFEYHTLQPSPYFNSNAK